MFSKQNNANLPHCNSILQTDQPVEKNLSLHVLNTAPRGC
jgi:hypothetical protein